MLFDNKHLRKSKYCTVDLLPNVNDNEMF